MGHYDSCYEQDAIQAQQEFNKNRNLVKTKIQKVLDSDELYYLDRKSDDVGKIKQKLEEALFWLGKL